MTDRQKKNTNVNKRKSNPYIKLFFSGAAGVGLYFLLIAVFSFIALKFNIPDKSFMPFGLIFGFLSGLFTGYTSAVPFKEKGLIYGSAGGLICVILCGTIAFAVNNGMAGTGLIILCAVIFVASLIGGIWSANKKQKRKR